MVRSLKVSGGGGGVRDPSLLSPVTPRSLSSKKEQSLDTETGEEHLPRRRHDR